jgi:hypothetical protein
MLCTKFRADMISGSSDEETRKHLTECPSCRELYQQVSHTMALLDVDAPVPEGLSARILSGLDQVSIPKTRRMNASVYMQIAAAILFGVFIGHQFGKIATTNIPKVKQDPINQYFKAHHFNVEDGDLKTSSLYMK